MLLVLIRASLVPYNKFSWRMGENHQTLLFNKFSEIFRIAMVHVFYPLPEQHYDSADNKLILCMLGIISADNILKYFFLNFS